MHVQWFVHLPGIHLETEGAHSVLEGHLAHLSFREWCEMDPSYPYSKVNYNRSQPAFYIGHAEIEGDLNEVLAQVSRRIYRLHQALLLDSRVPLLPEPQLSVHYVRVNLASGIATYRLVGPFEREWIVYGNQITYPLNEAAVQALEAVHELLPPDNATDVLPGIEAGIETMVRTAQPDVCWDQQGIHHINDFIHCTSAIGNILIPSGKEAAGLKIPPAFGQHAAVLVSASRIDLEELSQSYAGLYRLKSNLMHGQMTMADLSTSDRQVLRLGRILLREVLLKALVLNKYANDQASIATMLRQAYEDESYHQALHTRFKEVPVFA